MLADLPRACDVGTKRNAKGHTTSWIGYKLHVDTADGGVPISCIMTSASTHDSQVAIPLGTVTAGRVESLYDLMDAAYDSIEIWAHTPATGRCPAWRGRAPLPFGHRSTISTGAGGVPCRPQAHAGASTDQRLGPPDRPKEGLIKLCVP